MIFSPSCSLDISRHACIVESRLVWVTRSEGELGMVVGSVKIAWFPVETYYILVEGYIMSNTGFVGLVDRYAQRTEDCWMLLWFINNLFKIIVAHLMRVYHWWSCMIVEKNPL